MIDVIDFLGQGADRRAAGRRAVFALSSRLVLIRHFAHMFSVFRQAFHHEKGGRLTSFQALALYVAGRVGAGNIAGVAVA